MEEGGKDAAEEEVLEAEEEVEGDVVEEGVLEKEEEESRLALTAFKIFFL